MRCSELLRCIIPADPKAYVPGRLSAVSAPRVRSCSTCSCYIGCRERRRVNPASQSLAQARKSSNGVVSPRFVAARPSNMERGAWKVECGRRRRQSLSSGNSPLSLDSAVMHGVRVREVARLLGSRQLYRLCFRKRPPVPLWLRFISPPDVSGSTLNRRQHRRRQWPIGKIRSRTLSWNRAGVNSRVRPTA